MDAILGLLTRWDANRLQTVAEKMRELSLAKGKPQTAGKTMKGPASGDELLIPLPCPEKLASFHRNTGEMQISAIGCDV